MSDAVSILPTLLDPYLFLPQPLRHLDVASRRVLFHFLEGQTLPTPLRIPCDRPFLSSHPLTIRADNLSPTRPELPSSPTPRSLTLSRPLTTSRAPSTREYRLRRADSSNPQTTCSARPRFNLPPTLLAQVSPCNAPAQPSVANEQHRFRWSARAGEVHHPEDR
jgi:hypothetical protein